MFYCMLTGSYLFNVLIEIVAFILNDLKRYDLFNYDFKKYDKISDEKYSLIIHDFKIYSLFMICASALIIPLNIPYSENLQRISSIIVSVLFFVYCVFLLYQKRKNITRIVLCEFGRKIFRWLFTACICFLISLSLIGNNNATIDVKFSTNGFIEITNSSSYSFEKLKIEVYDEEKMIAEKEIEEKALLFAKENKYINSEVKNSTIAEGASLKDEILHWKSEINLTDMVEKDGQYAIVIISTQKGKKVILSNMFNVESGIFKFAKNRLMKSY